MFSFAGLSIYTLLANKPECANTQKDPVESLVTSAIIVESATASKPVSPLSLLDQANTSWMNSYNQSKDLSGFYLDNALLFPEKAEPLKSKNLIASYYTDLLRSGTRFTAVHPYQRFTETSDLIYETGYLTTQTQEIYQYMTVWKNVAGSWKRELETIAKKTAANNDAGQLELVRAKWMKLCNAHTPAKLLEEVYAENAYYYNRGRLLQGRKQLTEEYTYMADPNYQLTLTPKAVHVVNPDMVYEIGKCSGSYGGHYIIRWEKQPDSNWQVTLDTNY